MEITTAVTTPHNPPPGTVRRQRDFGIAYPLNADAPGAGAAVPTVCRQAAVPRRRLNTAQLFWRAFRCSSVTACSRGRCCSLQTVPGQPVHAGLEVAGWRCSASPPSTCKPIESSSQVAREAPALQGAFDGEGFSLFWRLLVIFFIASPWSGWRLTSPTARRCSGRRRWGAAADSGQHHRLALDKTLSVALSPDQVGAVIKAMGWRYLILWVFLFILWQSPTQWFTCPAYLPRVVLMPIAALLFGYFSVVMCAMMAMPCSSIRARWVTWLG